MVLKEFPKVLIIGMPFNKINGGGITMSNLFEEWPKENLALISTSNIRINADFSICDNYFQLGYKGKLHPFPLNILLPKIQCGPIKNDFQSPSIENNQLSGGKYKQIYQIIYKILIFTGLYNLLYRLKVTKELIDWIFDFNPDIIYSQLASLESIKLVKDIQSITKKPVSIHIMDDWPVSINKPSILYFYWKKKIDDEFRDLISKSRVLMSISQGMSDEYLKRYNRKFQPFHNPIAANKWLPYSKTSWEIKGRFRILYTGRLGVANSRSILLIAKVINQLNIHSADYLIDIYTPDYQSKQAREVAAIDGINVSKPVENNLMPVLLSGYDLLILPLDFDRHSVRFAKFSMPTKASEYMISGVPILIFANGSTYLARHAEENKWAFVVSDNNENSLASAIILLKSDMDLRKRIAETAVAYATHNEESVIVKEDFRKCLNFEM